MIIEFTFQNYRSFKEINTLHLQASKIKSKYPAVDEENIFHTEKYDLLKSKVIYGANASGKTNITRALVAMLRIIQFSFKDDEIIKNITEPFLLSRENKDLPIFFQISFIHDNIPFRYGMELLDGKIKSEWLFGTPEAREVYYFTREGNEVKFNENKFSEAKQLVNIPKGQQPIYSDTSLFLTVASASNQTLSKALTDYFADKISVLSGLEDNQMMNVALNNLDDIAFKKKLNELMSAADIGIIGMEKVDINPSEFPEEIQKQLKQLTEGKKFGFVEVSKKVFDENGKHIEDTKFNLAADESAGTKKLFSLAPFVFSALENGKVLVIDEFDARLHPRLTQKIIQLFNSKTTNPHNAQLIAISHDTNLMDAKLLRRDQISFVKKDKYGVSQLYSLIEFKGIRNNASFEKDYLEGKYDAVPFLNEMDNLFYNLQKPGNVE
jgi:AAA15 family ATPase/GTPase